MATIKIADIVDKSDCRRGIGCLDFEVGGGGRAAGPGVEACRRQVRGRDS